MTSEQEDILKRNIVIGDRAKKAYDLWVMNYLNIQYELCFEEFKNAKIEEMQLLRAKLDALNSIEIAIGSDIESGQMAKKQLGE